MTAEQERQQVYLGYFATILVALLVAGWIAGQAGPALAGLLPDREEAELRDILLAGLFFGVCFANPAAAFVRSVHVPALILRFAAGVVFGIALQVFVILPFVGEGLARFVLLFTAALGVPLMMAHDRVSDFLEARGSSIQATYASVVIRIINWPDRFLFLAVMLVSFVAFANFAPTMQATLIGLGAVLLIVTVSAAVRSRSERDDPRREQPDFEAWLELIPAQREDPDPMAEARRELGRMIFTLVPGAVFFGGLTWLAAFIVPMINPELGSPADITAPLNVTMKVALTGLAIVFFGALGAVGIGMVAIRLVGHYARWSKDQVRSASFRVLRTMSFRPIGSSAAQSSAGTRPSPRR